MTTLVTGAFGCIGAWVVRTLLVDGERPVATISATIRGACA
jgi:thioester reductase-like protein